MLFAFLCEKYRAPAYAVDCWWYRVEHFRLNMSAVRLLSAVLVSLVGMAIFKFWCYVEVFLVSTRYLLEATRCDDNFVFRP